MEKITPRNIYDEIADRLKEQIVSGVWAPGAKLPSTKELSETFGVGRSTVREALSALKAMGLVDSRQGGGSYVRRTDAGSVGMPDLSGLLLGREAVLELLEARRALESANAGLAARSRTEQDLQVFEQLLARMEQVGSDKLEGERLDVEFHTALAQATHNSIMVRLLETISGPMAEAIRETRRLWLYADPRVAEQLRTEHRRIYEAVRDGDGAAAQAAMLAHLDHVERTLRRYMA